MRLWVSRGTLLVKRSGDFTRLQMLLNVYMYMYSHVCIYVERAHKLRYKARSIHITQVKKHTYSFGQTRTKGLGQWHIYLPPCLWQCLLTCCSSFRLPRFSLPLAPLFVPGLPLFLISVFWFSLLLPVISYPTPCLPQPLLILLQISLFYSLHPLLVHPHLSSPYSRSGPYQPCPHLPYLARSPSSLSPSPETTPIDGPSSYPLLLPNRSVTSLPFPPHAPCLSALAPKLQSPYRSPSPTAPSQTVPPQPPTLGNHPSKPVLPQTCPSTPSYRTTSSLPPVLSLATPLSPLPSGPSWSSPTGP